VQSESVCDMRTIMEANVDDVQLNISLRQC
jgi:hypothetical protein